MSDSNNLKKKISPKAIAALIMEEASMAGSSEFIKEAHMRVFEHPTLLTEDWVKRINKWAKDTVTDMTLEEPKGNQVSDTIDSLGPLKIIKKIRRHSNRNRIFDSDIRKFIDCIAVDENGWKYWFRVFMLKAELKSGEACWPKKGSYVILKKAKVNEIKTGITFLSSVREVVRIDKE